MASVLDHLDVVPARQERSELPARCSGARGWCGRTATPAAPSSTTRAAGSQHPLDLGQPVDRVGHVVEALSVQQDQIERVGRERAGIPRLTTSRGPVAIVDVQPGAPGRPAGSDPRTGGCRSRCPARLRPPAPVPAPRRGRWTSRARRCRPVELGRAWVAAGCGGSSSPRASESAVALLVCGPHGRHSAVERESDLQRSAAGGADGRPDAADQERVGAGGTRGSGGDHEPAPVAGAAGSLRQPARRRPRADRTIRLDVPAGGGGDLVAAVHQSRRSARRRRVRGSLSWRSV